MDEFIRTRNIENRKSLLPEIDDEMRARIDLRIEIITNFLKEFDIQLITNCFTQERQE